MNADFALAELAVSQAGYLSRAQMDLAGMSRSTIDRRVKAGTLMVVRKGLYRVPGMYGDHRAHLRGAMAILPNPTISHESAAEFHRIPYIVRGKAVVTVHSRTTHGFPNVEVHRSLDLIDAHRQEADSLRWTTVARTLVDSAAVVHPRALARALDDSLSRKIVTIDELKAVFDHVARRGRTGCAEMRRLLAERLGDDLVTATMLEKVGMRAFDAGGLPPPVWRYPAPWDREKRIDFAWPHFRVGCECDSFRWHTRVDNFQNDRDRDNLALLHQWRIFRFTWQDFTKRPHVVIEQLRTALSG